MLDCTIIYILWIIEHNQDVSPEYSLSTIHLTIEPRVTACDVFVNSLTHIMYILLHQTRDGCTFDFFIAGKTAS